MTTEATMHKLAAEARLAASEDDEPTIDPKDRSLWALQSIAHSLLAIARQRETVNKR
jgi:hypothetical protein